MISLEEFLTTHRYERVDDPNIVFMKELDEIVYLVQITRATYDQCSTKEDYIRKNQQLIFNWNGKTGKNVRILNIIIVPSIKCKGVVEITENVEDVWILDEAKERIVLFENQKKEFDYLYEQLETWLFKEKKEESVSWKQSPITIGLVVINILIFFIGTRLGDQQSLYQMGAANWQAIFYGHEYYRLFTCMFLHFGIDHLFNNMLVLLIAGIQWEQKIGSLKFMIVYFISGMIGSVCSSVSSMLQQQVVISAGASGAIYGILGAIIVHIMSDRKRREQVSIMYLAVLAVGTLYLTVMGGDSTVDYLAHGVGFVTGACIEAICLIIRRKKSLA